MAEGRQLDASSRAESPAQVAGLSASGADAAPRGVRGLRARFARPALPDLSLAGYRRERLAELGLPVASALMEGGFIGVVADKIYHVHPAVLSLISAAPMFGLLLSAVWARLAHGRRKIPLLLALQVGFVASTAAVALLPAGPAGGLLLVLALVAARVLLSGTITLRSLVWTLNYPRASRARVTSRLQLIAVLTMTTTSLVAGRILDANAQHFRAVYAVGALLAVLGVLAFSRVRLLEEDRHLALERGDGEGAAESGSATLRGMLRLLRRDPLFARYQANQFLLGVSNMMIEAPMIWLVSRELGASYTTSVSITLAIPLACSMLSLPFWAAYIDRVHIAEFRARHSWMWVAAQFLMYVGAALGSLAWIGLGRLVLGLGRGGGSLAWQLGHNDFAQRGNVGLYMGVHVTLTGVRGATAPFLGMLLYVGWDSRRVLFVDLPGFDGLGAGTILVSCILSTLGTLGFVRLHRMVRERRSGIADGAAGGS